MNTRPTEFRTPSDLQAQARLERMLAARRAAEAAREARFRTLPTPQQPELANFCTPVDGPAAVSPWLFWPAIVTFSLVLTFASYEFATRVLPVLLGWLP